jgi:neutral trehalase
MNDDMPWVNLTQEEVEELRNKKHELTEYGKQKLRELAKEGISKYNEALQLMRNQEPYPDEMFEVAERREKSNRVLQRYNNYYNMECSGMPHGTPITPEHQQMITLQSMIDAIRCEYLNREYNEIAISYIEDLIQRLDEQATAFLERVQEFKDSADGVA